MLCAGSKSIPPLADLGIFRECGKTVVADRSTAKTRRQYEGRRFATRSPFRPNPIGLSLVALEEVRHTEKYGDVLIVSGADLMDQTPVYDIKPYLPHIEAVPDAAAGFAGRVKDYALKVSCPDELLYKLPEEKREALLAVLSEDPRPSYQNDEMRVYGFGFAGYEIKFRVKGDTLLVEKVEKLS